jgi:CRP/FNR family transcriptional regulator, cyclic AMP receptor protein
VVSLAPVKLISITAGQFIQAMLTDPQLQYTILKVMVQRLKLMNQRSQVRSHSPAKRLTNMLLELGQRYGSTTGEVTELFDVPRKDLANITDLSLEDTVQLMSRLSAKKLISVDPERQTLQLLNTKQLRLIAER